MLEDTTEIINGYIGCFSINITSTDFAEWLKKLNIKMVDRKRQVDLAQGKFNTIPYFSPNDYLQDRERTRLYEIGIILGYRSVGGVG